MKSRCIFLSLVCVMMVSSLAYSNSIVISDSDFASWSWAYDDHTANLDPNNNCSLEQVTGESNSTLTVTEFKKETDGSSWAFVHGVVLDGVSYNPSVDGAVAALDFSFKTERLTSGYVVLLPAIYQDGKCYVYDRGALLKDDATDGVYTKINLTSLGQNFWVEEQPDGGYSQKLDSNPDFSATGGEIQFGLVSRAGGSNAIEMEIQTSFDDFAVTVNQHVSDAVLVQEIGTIDDLIALGGTEDVDFKDYVMPNPDVDNGVRASAPSPFTGFASPDAAYTTLDPLPKNVGMLVAAKKEGQLVNVLFKDGSTNRTFSPLYGTRATYSMCDTIEFTFVDPNNTEDWNNPIMAAVSHVGFRFESVSTGAIEISFFDRAGNVISSQTRYIPSGTRTSSSYAAVNGNGTDVSAIHKVVFKPRLGNANTDYWHIGGSLGLPEFEAGVSFKGLKNCLKADITGDGNVDFNDLAVLAEQWLN